jgi:hypothetical protein
MNRAIRPTVTVLLMVVALASTVIACGQAAADYALVNRSDSTLAFAPGIIVPPCSDSSYSESTLRAAGDQLVDLYMNDVEGDEEAWIPQGAVLVEGIPPRRIGSASPMTFVISGSEPAYVEFGAPSRPRPACGGQPVLEFEQPAGG